MLSCKLVGQLLTRCMSLNNDMHSVSMQEKLAALEGKYRQAEEKLALQEARMTRSTPPPLGGSTSPPRTGMTGQLFEVV